MSGDLGEGGSKGVYGGYGLDLEPLDAKFVDEAVEATLQGLDLGPSTAGVLKDLLSRDSNSVVATSYFDDYNAKGLARSLTRVRRPKLFVDYVLSDEQISTLILYAPEFDLVFRSIDLHDHAMAAAMRTIDHAVINSRVPAMAKVVDVGGDILYHIRRGNVNVHCCNPDEDAKDDARAVMRRLAVKNMMDGSQECGKETREMLRSYTSGDEKHFCVRLAQDCPVKADVITSIHVYDIPMCDWPLIMEKKGATLVEGAVLFSDRFLSETSGELPESGVRFEVNTAEDQFKMGFTGSPSWWYCHKWTEFLRYAVDQRIVHGDNVYSYKVVERRSDTIYFRILAVQAKPTDFSNRLCSRQYNYPGVRMVEVNGFDFMSDGVSTTRDTLKRRSMMVAAPLWEALVNVACLEYERNALDFVKMYNAYRTIAPRHTINGVLISGGYSVDIELMKVVVVHAAIAGASRAMVAEKTNRAMTAGAFAVRSRLAQSTGRKLLGFALDIVKSAALLPVYLTGVAWLAKYLTRRMYDYSSMSMIAEVYEPEVKMVSCDQIVLKATERVPVDSKGKGFSRLAAASLVHDLLVAVESDFELAVDFLDNFGSRLTSDQLLRLQTSVDKMKAAREASETKAEDPDPKIVPEPKQTAPSTDVSAYRLAAIEEAILEVELEREVTEDLCRRMYSQIVIGNRSINKAALERDKEANENPDLWKITNGVLANHSVNGIPMRDFCHSRVYLGNTVEQPFCKVIRHVWHNDRTGVDEVNLMLADRGFDGYALVCDRLLIFNGDEILTALRASLKMDHSKYTVALKEGPPGCGKTYAIVKTYQPKDMVLCPVKLSIDDTKSRLLATYGPSVKSRDCARTVDSLLMHGTRSSVDFDRILADECFMAHAGKWYACAAILGVSQVFAYGDTKQIPHIPRVQCRKEHVSLRYDTRDFNNITRRCPADSVAAWCHLYGGTVRTTNRILNSISETDRFAGLQVSKDTCLMGMYQGDKKEIRRLYPNHESNAGKGMITTTHEAEGKTYKEVILFRFDRRIRKDNLSLYDKEPYVLVAISRHTERFVYARANGLGDLVSRWIAKTKDPRLVNSMLATDQDLPNG